MSDLTIPTATEAPASTPVSRRLPAIAALVAVVAVLGGGGWYGYTHFGKGSTAGLAAAVGSDFVPDAFAGSRMRGSRFVQQAPPPDGVTARGGGVFSVNAGGTSMMAVNRADGAWKLTFVGSPNLDRPAYDLLTEVRRLVDSKPLQKRLGVTDAQLAALAAIPEYPPQFNADQAARATALLDQLKKLTPADAKGKPMRDELTALVAAGAKMDRNAVKNEYAARAAKARATLTPAQLQSLTTPAAAPAPKPAAAPAAKPAAAAPATKPAAK